MARAPSCRRCPRAKPTSDAPALACSSNHPSTILLALIYFTLRFSKYLPSVQDLIRDSLDVYESHLVVKRRNITWHRLKPDVNSLNMAMTGMSDCTDVEWAIIELFIPFPYRVDRHFLLNQQGLLNSIRYMAAANSHYTIHPK